MSASYQAFASPQLAALSVSFRGSFRNANISAVVSSARFSFIRAATVAMDGLVGSS